MKPTKVLSILRYAHPCLMAFFPIIQLYAHNIEELQFATTQTPLILAGLATFLLLSILFFIKKSLDKPALSVSLFWVFFYSYGHLTQRFFPNRVPGLFDITYALALAILLFLIWRSSWNFKPLHGIFNMVCLVLLAFPLFAIAVFHWQAPPGLTKAQIGQDPFPEQLQKVLDNKDKFDKPDIYYFIFDRYASSASLRDYFHFSNEAFDQAMEKNNFYMAKRSMANYPYTFLSLPSSLNARYLDEMGEIKNSKDKTYAYRLLREAMVPRFLKKMGYRYTHLGSWWDPIRSNPYADKVLQFHDMSFLDINLNEFEEKLLQTTWLTLPLHHLNTPKTQTDMSGQELAAQKVKNQIQAVHDAIREPGPKYVFCHFLITHPHYYFAADGSINSPARSQRENDPQVYLDSIQFANQQILSLIKTIDQNSSRPAVIIIQADEGPYNNIIKPSREWKNEYSRLRLRSQIMNVLRIPGADPRIFYPELSPVNNFRLVFNTLFAAGLPLLPDHTLKYISAKDIYTFLDETQYLRQNEEFFATHPMEESAPLPASKR